MLLSGLSEDRIADLLFMHLRNMWAVDGLYYLGIEEKHGTEEATRIDANVWRVMGKIEGRRLKKFLGLGEGLENMVQALKFSGWMMDIEEKAWTEKGGVWTFKNLDCRIQNTRLKEGLPIFGCKAVRFDYLKEFAKVFGEDIVVDCVQCPPDELKGGWWCQWTFKRV